MARKLEREYDGGLLLKRETQQKGKKRRRNPLHRSFDDKRICKRKPI